MSDIPLYNGRVLGRISDSHIYTASIDGGKFVRKTGVTTFCGVLDKSRQLIPWAVGLAVDHIKEHRDLLDTMAADDIFEAAEEESERRKQEAADIGSLIHEWVEHDIKGHHPDMPEDDRVTRGVLAWMDWRDKHNAEVIECERMVYSIEHDYIGTLDFIAVITSCGGKCCGDNPAGQKLHVLGDIKTGNGIYESYALQTAGYAKAFLEESGTTFDGRVIVRLAKEDEQQYNERIAKKNERRMRKEQSPITDPYQVFEVAWLDMAEGYRADIQAFLAAVQLHRWQYPAKKRLDAGRSV